MTLTTPRLTDPPPTGVAPVPAAPATVLPADAPAVLRARSLAVRRAVVDMCAGREGGHLGGALSCVDVLTTLYFAVLRVDPACPDHPERDIFVLSKGHAALGLYATLAERGFLPRAELATFATSAGRLMSHPVRAVPGVEHATGSLGHGLAYALGRAVAARLAGSPRRAFVLLGDGELQEGSVWEAAQCAAAQGTDNLVAIVDRNDLQLTGRTEDICALEPLADRWRAFGWAVDEVDGHDHAALLEALGPGPRHPGRPRVLIAHTRKGDGLPFVAGHPNSHYATLNPRMARKAHRALDAWAAERGAEHHAC